MRFHAGRWDEASPVRPSPPHWPIALLGLVIDHTHLLIGATSECKIAMNDSSLYVAYFGAGAGRSFLLPRELYSSTNSLPDIRSKNMTATYAPHAARIMLIAIRPLPQRAFF
jgi:hypothetical protein